MVFARNPNLQKVYISANPNALSLAGLSHDKLSSLFISNCEGLFTLPSMNNFSRLAYACVDKCAIRTVGNF